MPELGTSYYHSQYPDHDTLSWTKLILASGVEKVFCDSLFLKIIISGTSYTYQTMARSNSKLKPSILLIVVFK